MRRDAATAAGADRERAIASAVFAAGTGVTFTHAGTNYTDVTGSPEVLELWNFDGRLVDMCIQVALSKLIRLDRTPLIGYRGNRYALNDANGNRFSWINSPGDVRAVKLRESPWLTRNGQFDKWNTTGTTGALTPPDHWVLAGASGTALRTTTGVRQGDYGVEITRAGTDATLTQTIGLLWDGVSGDSLQSEVVSYYVAGTADAATQVRVRVTDGVDTTNSDYLTSGAYTVVTGQHTINAAATTLTIQVRVETTNGSPEIDRCELLWGSSIPDGALRDDYRETQIEEGWDQGNGPLALRYPRYGGAGIGFGRQLVIESLRPYPQFDSTRLIAGSADADSTDAPLTTLAICALAELQESGAGRKREDWKKNWRDAADFAAGRHLYEDSRGKMGINFRPPQLAPPPVRASRW